MKELLKSKTIILFLVTILSITYFGATKEMRLEGKKDNLTIIAANVK